MCGSKSAGVFAEGYFECEGRSPDSVVGRAVDDHWFVFGFVGSPASHGDVLEGQVVGAAFHEFVAVVVECEDGDEVLSFPVGAVDDLASDDASLDPVLESVRVKHAAVGEGVADGDEVFGRQAVLWGETDVSRDGVLVQGPLHDPHG